MVSDAGSGASSPDAAEQKQLQTLIRKIPLFSGLTPEDAACVLDGAVMKSFPAGSRICTQGEAPESLFILLKGKLSVSITNSATIATINPVNSIGELGVFTGHPRNATIDAMEQSSVLELKKADIDNLIGRVPALGVRILKNIVVILSDRIAEDNIKLREYQNYVISQLDADQQQ